MKYFIIAGEASGDLHGSNLIKGLVAEDPGADIRCWGGNMMQAAGGTLLHDYADGAVMGFGDILKQGGKLLKNIRKCEEDILDFAPDVVILIDYPGFNMKIARFCHESGIKVFYYIAPKTWASRENRNRKLKKWVDRLFIVFPFEIPYFTAKGVPFIYEGNPLIDAVDSHEFVKVSEDGYIAVLAGSRKAEISRMMPVCMEVADRLHAERGWKFIIAGAPSRSAQDYDSFISGREGYVSLIFDRTYDILKGAEAAVINSGTASLEAALIGTPQVVAWSTGKITAFIGRHILRILDHIKFISLGNLIIDRLAFRELIQEDFTAENVCSELISITSDPERREKMLSDYAEIRSRLGGSGASRSVARAMIEELRK